ncbi:MAG: hypothetical protein JW775_11050, partial [Candidatus Aminicenantes bacterium]|nr:hypothetical protein [Candidatus Aminicenantes bacterium]
ALDWVRRSGLWWDPVEVRSVSPLPRAGVAPSAKIDATSARLPETLENGLGQNPCQVVFSRA